MPPTVVQLAGLQTEGRNPRSAGIDVVSTQELCRILNREDARVPAAVEACIPVIAAAIEALSQRVRNGGRVFYIGAGTSGRLGVLDASEIPPTYSSPAGQFVALIAGGDDALRRAKEGAEDSTVAAEADLRPLGLNPEVDSLIGIASSGRTPYVLGGLSYARSLGCTTVGVVCVEPSAVGKEANADYLIAAVTGPEVVTGSTRMKAGTATKLVLNMISTGIMIKLGKTYGNLMIDVKATNVKLKQRAKNILRAVGGVGCTQSDEELESILEACQGSVKLAAVTIVLGVSVSVADEHLKRHEGVLTRVFEEDKKKRAQQETQDDGFVLCIDAGGTSCKAVVMSRSGATGNGSAGPCNATSGGLHAAMSSISKAIQAAVDDCEATKGRQFQSINLSAAWVGMAGYERASLAPLIDTALSKLLRLPIGERLKVTTDIDLLPAGLISQALDSIIVVVAGTGSVAMSFQRVDGGFRRSGRAGGWGHLLGDDGSGYGIGREAIRRLLQSSDLRHMQKTRGQASEESLPALSQAVLQHFKAQDPACDLDKILSTILVPDPPVHRAEDGAPGTTERIAEVSRVVLSMAAVDEDARRIVEAGAASLAQLVTILVKVQGIEPANSGLVVGGGLMSDDLYRNLVTRDVEEKCGKFAHTEVVYNAALEGARQLFYKAYG